MRSPVNGIVGNLLVDQKANVNENQAVMAVVDLTAFEVEAMVPESYADDLGITVNAGHGLTYHNVAPIAALPEIYELNIGHSIMGRAVFDGLNKAVADMKAVMETARNNA